MPVFHVGMCNHDGSSATRDFATTSVQTRFDALKMAVRTCFGAQLTPGDLYCFVAPEFFFGNVALPKADYRQLVELCGGLYTTQNFILVPGSIVTYSGSKLAWKSGRFANRIPVLYGGQVLNYQKQTWGGEVGAGGVGTYRNGTLDGDFNLQFGANNYRFAIEVCMEHDSGTVANANYAPVDVHIITANTVSFKPANAMGTSFTLHCNASMQAPSTRTGPYGHQTCNVYDQHKNVIAPTTTWQNQIFYWNLML